MPGCRSWAPRPDAIDLAEDRGRFGALLTAAGLPAPAFGTATSFEQARVVAARIGYPVLVRPSYVLGGRGMEIVYDEPSLADYIERSTEITSDHPVLVDRFLDDAIEVDVDALCDGTEVYLGGVMEHIEEAGIHSGDSACVLPPITLGRSDIATVRRHTEAIAFGVGVRGLLNVQYALKDECCTCWRPTRGRRAPCRSPPRPPRCRWPRPPPGSCWARPSRSCGPRACCPPPATAETLPPGAPVAVKEAVLPFHRFRRAGRQRGRLTARPGDAVHRRGDGHRHLLRPGVREVADRRRTGRCPPRAPCSSRWPTPTSGPWSSR